MRAFCRTPGVVTGAEGIGQGDFGEDACRFAAEAVDVLREAYRFLRVVGDEDDAGAAFNGADVR